MSSDDKVVEGTNAHNKTALSALSAVFLEKVQTNSGYICAKRV